jgi:hypothetical protein
MINPKIPRDLYEFCKVNGFCNNMQDCDAGCLTYLGEYQNKATFTKNENAESDETQLRRIQEGWEREIRAEARRKLSEFNERKRSLVALGMPEATAAQLATSETMENEIKHSRFVFPSNFEQLSGEQKIKLIDKARRIERGESP